MSLTNYFDLLGDDENEESTTIIAKATQTPLAEKPATKKSKPTPVVAHATARLPSKPTPLVEAIAGAEAEAVVVVEVVIVAMEETLRIVEDTTSMIVIVDLAVQKLWRLLRKRRRKLSLLMKRRSLVFVNTKFEYK
ncbi:hypothetical protein AXG93_2338s1170 [Marchantia polymorpha subsp. ruderalis]|uniref:STM1-like N-terminal domain-containing protein n=1 Tax=Marchantia polymorpha subsp. ruderalis TaxID=1480154 RepID=A0A176VH97_MARPO|nr:hypothetical protein AXG93_2338s1170 [Marchantia polymorpha subsp. ruderalis]